MSNYTKTTNFAVKDTLPSGDANKIVKGTEIDAEFNALAVASATKANKTNPSFTGEITIGSASINETELEILDGATVTTTELNYVDGVTSPIQTQIDTKLNSSTVSAFGATLIDDADASAARTTLGLGTAATTASTDYATAAQGTTADAALPKAGGALTGAVTTNSTFDGRDVAADGTKLDGIEASADVTDTTNVVAALSAGTGISLSAGGEIANTAPDQTVALTGAGTTTITGTYPNFTITSSSASGGISLTDLSVTVASVGTANLAYNNTSGVFTYTPPDLSTYLTASSTATLTNKSGNISQWTNDSGYTTNAGDITSVVAGTGLSGGATSGAATLNIDSTVATLTGSQTLTNKALTSPALTTPTIEGGASDWQFSVSGNDLIISYGGTSKAKLDTSGNLTVIGNVTAYGTV
tara:strand:+ start:77 stop:1318 length:1242 start_codon:yes stop_codon:yes gene_type:complete